MELLMRLGGWWNTRLYRWFGLIEASRTGIRFRRVELSWERLGLALGLILWDHDEPHYSAHVHVLWLNCFVKLPGRPKREVPLGEMSLTWGFTVFERTVHVAWGGKTRIYSFPWDWVHVRHSVRLPNGDWGVAGFASFDWKEGRFVAHDFLSKREPLLAFDDGRWFDILPYRYVMRSGAVQERLAAVHVSQREWRWKALRRLPWPRMVNTSLEIDFNGEVGEGTGSWKGGTVGCSYTLRRGESPVECLRRMERERRFHR